MPKVGSLNTHWIKPEKRADAIAFLEYNGNIQSKFPGFISRQILYSLSDPNKITTLTIWGSNQILDAWRASSQRTAAMDKGGAHDLWAKTPESERFDVADS